MPDTTSDALDILLTHRGYLRRESQQQQWLNSRRTADHKATGRSDSSIDEPRGIGDDPQIDAEAQCSAAEIEALEASYHEATLPDRVRLAFDGRAPRFDPLADESSLDQKTILRNSSLRTQLSLVRMDRSEGIKSGLIAIISALSGNKHWRSSPSIPRLAKLLRRDEKTIRRGLKALTEDGLLVRSESKGFSTTYSIQLTTLDADPDTSPVTILDALAPRPAGRWGSSDASQNYGRSNEYDHSQAGGRGHPRYPSHQLGSGEAITAPNGSDHPSQLLSDITKPLNKEEEKEGGERSFPCFKRARQGRLPLPIEGSALTRGEGAQMPIVDADATARKSRDAKLLSEALADYTVEANAHDYRRGVRLTHADENRLLKRLRSLPGIPGDLDPDADMVDADQIALARWRKIIAAIWLDDWYAGRRISRTTGNAFRFGLDWLLPTDSAEEDKRWHKLINVAIDAAERCASEFRVPDENDPVQVEASRLRLAEERQAMKAMIHR